MEPKTESTASLVKQLLWWYPLSSPLLLVRTPLIYGLTAVGLPLWAAIVVEFLIERPLFFLVAREINRRVK